MRGRFLQDLEVQESFEESLSVVSVAGMMADGHGRQVPSLAWSARGNVWGRPN